MTDCIYQTPNLTPNQQKYLKHYKLLCERGQSRGTKKEALDFYTEAHHILPKCMGGSFDKSNMTLLTPEEHFVAHQLLVKIFPNNWRLSNAIIRMNHDSNMARVGNKIYGWLKRKISDDMKSRNKTNDAGRLAASEKRKGLTKENCEFMASMAAKLSGRTKEEYPHLRELGERNRLFQSGKNKENCEWKARGAENQNKLPPELRKFVIDQRETYNKTFPEIKDMLDELGYSLTKSAVGIIYRRETRQGKYANS